MGRGGDVFAWGCRAITMYGKSGEKARQKLVQTAAVSCVARALQTATEYTDAVISAFQAVKVLSMNGTLLVPHIRVRIPLLKTPQSWSPLIPQLTASSATTSFLLFAELNAKQYHDKAIVKLILGASEMHGTNAKLKVQAMEALAVVSRYGDHHVPRMPQLQDLCLTRTSLRTPKLISHIRFPVTVSHVRSLLAASNATVNRALRRGARRRHPAAQRRQAHSRCLDQHEPGTRADHHVDQGIG